MQKGNVDSAIKLITNNMQTGIPPLTDTTLKLFKQKHPKSAPTTEGVLLPDQPFAERSTDLCTTIANMIKKLCIGKDLANTLETFLSYHLIPLDKNPGL